MKRWGKHQSLWLNQTRRKNYEVLRQDLTVDVAIVGAGITGLTAALFLARAGCKVAVVTDGQVGGGTTGYSTGHLTQVLDTDFGTLVSDFGRQTAADVAASTLESIELIENLSHKLNIDCGFRRVPGFKFTETPDQIKKLASEVAMARELGIDCSQLKNHSLPFPVAAAACFENQAEFDPLRYVLGLAENLTALGVPVYENSRVEKIKDGAFCEIETEHGLVRARDIILATHTPVGIYISLHTRVAPYFSYCLAVRLENPPEEGLYWDMDDPYQYLRRAGEEDDLWIVGGKDHKTGQEFSTLEKYLELEDYVRLHFDVKEIVSYWGSEFYKSNDGLPYIGKIPFTSHIHTGTGYSGTGLTFGTLAGQILADSIVGKKNKHAPLYDPMRIKPLASAGSFIKENMNVARWMVSDLLTHEERRQFKSIPPDEGRIIEIGGTKMAVYKDERGNLYSLSPECTHMGCHVHWNSAEKTWDCPCHGGRYRATGEVFSGPPLRDLETVSLTKEIERELVPHLNRFTGLTHLPGHVEM